MLALRIAFRYLFSKKSTNAINIISWVSMLGMGVGAFALIVVLSVFNGFEGLVLSLYGSFYPDIQITTAEGKRFESDTTLEKKILQLSSVYALSRTIEESAYLEYGGQAQIGTIKGVDEKYTSVTSVNEYVRSGKFELRDSVFNYAITGANIAYALNINPVSGSEALRITVPRRGVRNAMVPEDAFSTADVLPSGIFSIQQEFDSKYVFIPIALAQELTGSENEVSAYEIKIKPNQSLGAAKEEIAKLCGRGLLVRDRFEQKQELYRIMKIERWAVFAILSFIMLIISFNIIGSLSMLVIEKQRDISILRTMGATPQLIQKIFLLNGILNATIGAFAGVLLGYAVGLAQQKFGFVKLTDGGGTFVIDAYPVAFNFIDFAATFGVVVFISLLASYFPAKRSASNKLSFQAE
jgi:lipoprotein-releasing system permease protein